ncbi:aminotransferase class I/II-fold pyridoxal phosphate-dependent enzyme [Cupriavidus malaysiensis]|uniref:aminotransferase class I/II-fold pyridoxal phosphate-dependent enzyme n=1 Tax=Cupriavidus malaysiensis TaxID=367825 RepID=UPI0012FFC3D1|nr:aminotransferase class I/II-fold pyridoxal phosphate-dependent enzyme [Cupriavidus malaysiensis]
MQTSEETSIANYAPLLNGREREYVAQAIESGWVSYGGWYVREFETSLAQTFGCADAVTVASGTCALQLAFELSGKRDTEILIPALTFAAPASAAVRAGMHPVFVDLDPKTWQVDDELLAAFLEERCVRREGHVVNTASGRRVSTICLVHLWGDLARLDRIHALARQWNLVVIHDAAQCLGARYKGLPLGATVPDDQVDQIIITTSFNANKIITTGAGGALIAKSQSLCRRARHLSSTAKADTMSFFHDDYGLNFRMSNINAAIGVAQMEMLSDRIHRKQRLHQYYVRAIRKRMDGVRFAHQAPESAGICWMNCIELPQPSRSVIEKLVAQRIMVRPVWIPLPQLPVYSRFEYYQRDAFSARLHEHAIMLPSGPGVTEAQADRVVSALAEACR